MHRSSSAHGVPGSGVATMLSGRLRLALTGVAMLNWTTPLALGAAPALVLAKGAVPALGAAGLAAPELACDARTGVPPPALGAEPAKVPWKIALD